MQPNTHCQTHFEALIERYRRGLARAVASYEADQALQQDLFQEVCVAIWRAQERLRDIGSEAAYIYRIAHNVCVNHVTREARRPRQATLSDGLVSSDDPSIEAELAVSARRLMAAMRQLPLGIRQVVVLRLEGLEYTEIARSLGISISNVGVRVNRGKALLYKELANETD